MTAKKIVIAIALFLSATLAAQADDYTSGTQAGDAVVGLPTPGGYGTGLHAYASGYGYGHAAKGRHQRRGRIGFEY
jgi:hypothetical protein